MRGKAAVNSVRMTFPSYQMARTSSSRAHSRSSAQRSSHRRGAPVTLKYAMILERHELFDSDDFKRDLMAAQYILTIEKLSKAFGKKEVLKNIWLSFYPGAKIGVIGGNGSGKSTLLKIMARIDNDYIGTARPTPGITIGYRLPGADARSHAWMYVAMSRSRWPDRGPFSTRFDEINARLGEADRRRRNGQAARRAGQGSGRDRGR